MTLHPVLVGLLVAAAIAGAVWAWRVWRGKDEGRRQSEVKRLRDQYLRETGLPLEQAYGSMERHLERLMKEQPGRPMAFYLRSILAELRRDRR